MPEGQSYTAIYMRATDTVISRNSVQASKCVYAPTVSYNELLIKCIPFVFVFYWVHVCITKINEYIQTWLKIHEINQTVKQKEI